MYICTFTCAICLFSIGGTRMERFNWSITALVAWRAGLFLTEGKIGMLSVLFYFKRGWEFVWVYVCVCLHTHTHCTDGVFRCDPRSQHETTGGPEESGLGCTKSRHIYIFVNMFKVHMCMYMLAGGMRFWTNCFFL